jgi:hypothetical protein
MTDKGRTYAVLFALAFALCALAPVATPAAAEEMETLRFEANVMAGSGQGGHRSTMIEIRVRAWTTEEERQMVLDEIKEASAQSTRNRNRAVARALRGASRVGSMNLRAQTSWPIRYSRLVEGADGSRRILLATDRPVTFAEAFGNTQAGDFDVTLVELIFDAEGNGRGSLSLGTEVRWNDAEEKLEVTNLTSQPVRLGNVRQVGG